MDDIKVINVEVSKDSYKKAKLRAVELELSLKDYIEKLIQFDSAIGLVDVKKVRK